MVRHRGHHPQMSSKYIAWLPCRRIADLLAGAFPVISRPVLQDFTTRIIGGQPVSNGR
jgi:hypothetical protein